MDTTHWVRGSFNFGITLAGLVFGVCLTINPVEAAFRVHLDEPTLSRGYTITLPNGQFSLGIPKNTLSTSVRVALKRPTLKEEARVQAAVEPEWSLTGKIRVYNLTIAENTPLNQPVWVSIHTSADLNQDYFIAFYDAESESWKKIPSSLDWTTGQLSAALPFTYATVAAFSTPHFGPRQITDFQTADSSLGFLQAAAAVVMDLDSGQLLYSKNSDEVRPIASMTKVVTTRVALAHASDWSQTVAYSDTWSREGAALRVANGEQLSIQDLLYTTLVGSANNTAVALANVFLDQRSFVGEMNSWVSAQGLTSTHFVEPSGLDARNVSTAHEYALLSRAAFQSFSMLQLATTKAYTLHLPITGDHTIHTTDNLLYSDLYITGGKTGYTEEAGYCLMIQTKNAEGHQIIVVVMGEPTSADRFTETYALTKWAFANYVWN